MADESSEAMDLSYILNHLGEERSNYYNAVAPPLIQSSNFCFPDVATMRANLAREFEVPFYTRGFNPTVGILRQKIAALEGTEDALVFASGSAAVAAAVISVVKQGDHVICVNKPYSWTNKLLNNLLAKYGVTTTMVDGTVTNNFREAIRPETTLIMLESPNSMTFEMQDLEAVSQLAKQHNITTVIDNSYSTPLHQQPAALGVDIVIHSASKYLGGHSDIVAGALCSTKERVMQIFESELMTLGGLLSPHDSWLMLRGLRTLPLRLERSANSALAVAKFLEQHEKVAGVLYPFLPSHPQYELAKKQMKKGSGLLSVLLKADHRDQVEAFCDNLKLFLLACSWGGHESLVFPVCALGDGSSTSATTLPANLIRFYVGLEDPNLLIADLEQALTHV